MKPKGAMDPSQHELAKSFSKQSNPNATRNEKGDDVDIERTAEIDASAQVSENDEGQNDVCEQTKDPFLVQWDESDVQNPRNWTMTRKWCLVAFLSWITLLT